MWAIAKLIFGSSTTWIVLAVIGIAAVIGIQQWRINHLKSVNAEQVIEIQAAKAEIDAKATLVKQWSQSYDTLKITVAAQNQTIAGLEAEVAERMKRAKEALRQAEVVKIKADNLAGKIKQMEVAKDECTAMRQLIDAYVGGMR